MEMEASLLVETGAVRYSEQGMQQTEDAAMTPPFADTELRQLAKTRKNTDVPAQWISALARELLEARRDARRYRHLRADGCTYGPGWYCNEKLDAVLDAEMAALAEGK